MIPVRWSRLSPRLALVPALVVTAVAFVGTICWTVFISFTKSRRFPDYAIDFIAVRLTQLCLKNKVYVMQLKYFGESLARRMTDG